MRRRRNFLEEGEVVLYAARPHLVVLARPLTGALVALAAISYAFVAWSSAPMWFGIVLGALTLVAAVVVCGRVLRYRAGLLVITSRRVTHREGFVRRVGREIPISKVEDVTYSQGLVGRLFGYGEVIVESAGAAPSRPFRAVRRPEEVQHAIHRAAEAASRPATPRPSPVRAPQTGGSPPEQPPPAALVGVDEQLALLEALHRRGFVSEAELAAKRDELLGRAG